MANIFKRIRKRWLCRKYGICPVHGQLRASDELLAGAKRIRGEADKSTGALRQSRNSTADTLEVAAEAIRALKEKV